MDADLELANLPAWELTVGGRTYRARPLSWPAYRRFELSIAAAIANEDVEAHDRAVRDALREAFPPRWRYLIHPGEDPVPQVMALTPVVRRKLFADFFGYLELLRGPVGSTTTPSSDSSPRTVPGGDAPASSPLG
jgi:hypothetical protein